MPPLAMYVTNSVWAVDKKKKKTSVRCWISFDCKSKILGGQQDWI